VGIGDEDLDRIFEPFYTKKIMGRSGTGLGMSVVWGTVRDHDGYTDINTSEGQGTCFTLYFPASKRELSSDRTAFTLEQYGSKGESVLVVDDLWEQRFFAKGMLEKLGYQVWAVESGEAALDHLTTNTADLVVMDMIMEGEMDGLETYRRILDLCPGIRAVLVSGYSESARVKEAQALGAGPYLRKPYSMEDLALAVRKELDR
jgi:CheY-like chemotaxis protein